MPVIKPCVAERRRLVRPRVAPKGRGTALRLSAQCPCGGLAPAHRRVVLRSYSAGHNRWRNAGNDAEAIVILKAMLDSRGIM